MLVMFNVTMTKIEAKQAIGATWVVYHAWVREQSLSRERTVGSSRPSTTVRAGAMCTRDREG